MTAIQPIESFLARLQHSFEDGSFVRLVLSGASRETPVKLTARLIELQGRPVLSVSRQQGAANTTSNHPASEATAWVRGQLREHFRSALLNTTRGDWQLHLPANGAPRLVKHKPAFRSVPARTHDESAHQILDASAADWMHGLGISDATGRVRLGMTDKYRQINRYLELLSHLAKDCGWLEPTHLNPNLTLDRAAREPEVEADGKSKIEIESKGLGAHGELTVADMGCGKGYLTFGAWHLFRRVCGLSVRVRGIEARRELVEFTNALARGIGADGLEFQLGTIEASDVPRVDVLIALHACNTATDDAIRRGIDLGAKLIVVAPCCHKELRPQLGKPEPLAAVLRHGIMEERLAEWLTDGLRALFLEWAGYRTKVFEFIASEHTPKNLMIAAIREREPFSDESVRRRIEELKRFFGLQHQALDPLLTQSTVEQASRLSVVKGQETCSTLDEPPHH